VGSGCSGLGGLVLVESGEEVGEVGGGKFPFERFRGLVVSFLELGEPVDDLADITEVVITGLNATAIKLVVESWTPERGLRSVERD
jgi:hypothetical protein